MNGKSDGGPAFPAPDAGESDYGSNNRGAYRGLTMRDYFAAKALPAIVAAYVEANGRCIGTEHIHSNCAAHAYKMADAMLKEREA